MVETLKEHVKDGDAPKSVEVVKKLLADGVDPGVILNQALIPSMDEAGELFKKGEFFIPEIIIAARAMQESLAILKPLLVKDGVKSKGKIILGTVKGDMHDIGKNIVGITFEGAGFEVVDLGVDVPADKFVEAITKHLPIAVGLSSLLTVTMLEMRGVIEAIKEAGLREKVKIIIGGAPVNQAYADEVGADFTSHDPISAKQFVEEHLNSRIKR
ncbi:MAG: corrinoid protein, partial [Candidatus Lokiarchaeota archaeon]|nr:corrinoid protein [Candidatus Lokiarchaeota archaeon]